MTQSRFDRADAVPGNGDRAFGLSSANFVIFALVSTLCGGCLTMGPDTTLVPPNSAGKPKLNIEFGIPPRDPLVAAGTPRYQRVEQPPNPVISVNPLIVNISKNALIESRYPNVGSLKRCKADFTAGRKKGAQEGKKEFAYVARYCIVYGENRTAYVLKVE